MPLSQSFLASVVGLLGLLGEASGAAVSYSYPSSLVASTYFAGFHANRGFPVSDMSWDKFTDVKYAFAETTPDGSLDLSKSEPDQISAFVDAAKENGVKALISIGGWTGSRWFSTSFGSAKNRTAFVNTCLELVKEHNLDGLDFDWEYPNRQGLGCNAINENDTANFLSFLEELREHSEGKDLYLTAAGSLFPWNDASGVASTDLDGFASVLDYIMIMNYDLYGAWSATGGPNAPLSRTCDSRNNQGAGDEAVAKWTAAGIPSSQLVLGVPAYGHGFSVNKTSAFGADGKLSEYPPQNSSHRFQGSSWDSDPPVDDCGNAQPPGGTYTFWSLITEAKFLDAKGNPARGIAHAFDNCSKTPALYSSSRNIWVSYDDARSFREKGKFVLKNNLGGFATYEAGGDYNNILINAIRKATGLD
ncbi:glycoside hydrolase superfamily [Dactylonectria macrodidyma]|uniref:chitinase n=1 Tax=Dactylonectria macrodidyma TaxID=307937 RepID=A0A9P9ES39_9HYPO|nr:glycoside hydrolase superfamily [Dactylonectria macrodidyma]